MYIVTVCVGLLCTNFVDTKFSTQTMWGCVLKGREIAHTTGHAWYVKTGCRHKDAPGSKSHGW